ncbi:MAG TPA: hypothetical protein VLI90_12620 [Tepidisphaeraceae bacterium]|nr:hypothetical protein [Tepidisphaeraceae bacterium]
MSKLSPAGADLREQLDAALRELGEHARPPEHLEDAAAGAKSADGMSPGTGSEEATSDPIVGASNFFG